MNSVKLLILLVSVVGYSSFGQTDVKIENLKSFAKVYGYVKYFHPSDEAAAIDWNRFAIYSSEKVEKCQTKEQLYGVLNTLFLPIAPTMKFYYSQGGRNDSINTIIPTHQDEYNVTYWQHLGVSKGMNNPSSFYKSVRVNRNYETKIFEAQPQAGEVINKDIGNGISCVIPLELYSNGLHTYPVSKIDTLESGLKMINTDEFSLSQRLGDVIIAWNVFKHFYPYLDVVKINWEKELEKALQKCYIDKDINNFIVTLQQFTAPLKDGHMWVSEGLFKLYTPPIAWEHIENKLVITCVCDNHLKLKVGDIVTQINGLTPERYFQEVEDKISAATSGWLHYMAETLSLCGEKNSKLSIVVNNEIVDLNCTEKQFCKEKCLSRPIFKNINKNTIYLNLTRIEMSTIDSLLPYIANTKTLICDLRGYPNNNHDLISYLLNEDDTCKGWMQIPEFIYPDQEKIVGYEKEGWGLKAKKPHIKANVFFLIDGSAISYAESYMAFIEGYKLATIIGQPTAGTNGNINSFTLPGHIEISWTGMKVVKHNGSQQHGKGIVPNIYVNKSIKGVIECKDEFLEKAIELSK